MTSSVSRFSGNLPRSAHDAIRVGISQFCSWMGERLQDRCNELCFSGAEVKALSSRVWVRRLLSPAASIHGMNSSGGACRQRAKSSKPVRRPVLGLDDGLEDGRRTHRGQMPLGDRLCPRSIHSTLRSVLSRRNSTLVPEIEYFFRLKLVAIRCRWFCSESNSRRSVYAIGFACHRDRARYLRQAPF